MQTWLEVVTLSTSLLRLPTFFGVVLHVCIPTVLPFLHPPPEFP
ncbi:MAG: hypothetical protein ACE5ER_05345 [Nitrospinaceae bacterium]